MKKILIILIVIVLGLTAYDVYSFIDMNNTTKLYQTKQDEYHTLLDEEIKKDEEINSLNKKLDELKNSNIDNNKEYSIWMSLNKTIQELLK